MAYSNESVIEIGKSIPIIAILHANSFSDIDKFLNDPKKMEEISAVHDNSYIYGAIWKIVGQREDEKLITEFNTFIENKKKILNN